MSEAVLARLKEYVEVYSGNGDFEEKQCYSYLKDFCGDSKRELFMISAAVREGIPRRLKELSLSKDSYLMDLELESLADKLSDNLGFSKEHSLWTVKTWAKALSLDLGGEKDTSAHTGADMGFDLDQTVYQASDNRTGESKSVDESNNSSDTENKYYGRRGRGIWKKVGLALAVIAIIGGAVSIDNIRKARDGTELSVVNAEEYILPNSDKEYLSDGDINRLVESEDIELVRLAINEVYARHGLVFEREYYDKYFKSKSWYSPRGDVQGEDQVYAYLNEIERQNISTLLSIKDNLGAESDKTLSDIENTVDNTKVSDDIEIKSDDEVKAQKDENYQYDTNNYSKDTEIFYRVVVGSFREKSNAENLVYTLSLNGFNGFIIEPWTDSSVTGAEHLYSVINESYHSLDNAEIQAGKLRSYGFDTVISVYER